MIEKKKLIFNVEGPNWKQDVAVDPEIFDTERLQYLEAGTKAIEMQKEIGDLDLGPIICVRKGKSKKEALVNSYLCLINCSEYELAEELRVEYKKQSGQDLAVDDRDRKRHV